MSLKRLEQWWRRIWIRMLVRLMRRADDSRPNWDARPVRVLFLRHDRLGDMIVSTGVMRAIARSHATISLDVLASPLNAGILDGADYVGEVIVFDKKHLSSYLPTARRLRRARYDAVIDCMVTAPSVTTLLLVLASGARYRVGIAGRGNDSAFNVLVSEVATSKSHMIDRLAALARPFRAELSEAERRPVLEISADERARAESAWGLASGERVLVNISAGTSERRWPDDSYAAVIQHILRRSPAAIVRVIASPSEADRAERIARGGGGSYATTKSVRDALALVATADFVFTPDTSIVHAVSAFTKPAVAIYGKGKRSDWDLYGTAGVSVEHTEWELQGLSVDRVLAAIDTMWDEMAVSRRG
jgi:ADP-heptose:LPS heptosyltransferase